MSSNTRNRRKDALEYHEKYPKGKLEVVPTKAMQSQADLALAYSPGVADPCLEIAKDKSNVYKYTTKGNLVGVISNGTAVLGLGNIGPEASKPVMEGKAVLFKKFAGIDVFDIEINTEDPEEFVKIVKSLEPTFGGINLEDIKAPDSFYIETTLKEQMSIPVMHDDQHGTAIISAAALQNALELVGKNINDIKLVVNGAGAAAIATTRLYIKLGAKKENIIMVDSKGCIRADRSNLEGAKLEFATHLDINTLAEALVGADLLLGLSVANCVTPEMLLTMAENPIVFALANPDPEIRYDLAMKTRKDIIMATGRSDHPNQVNNVLGFPYIFRGALDVHATSINEEMKLAAVKALSDLAKQPVPELVARAYSDRKISFGKEYLIPKPLDPRLLTSISPKVAQAAIASGVANNIIEDWAEYELELEQRIGKDDKLVNYIINQAKKHPKRIVFTEADNYKTLKAVQNVVDEGIASPILLGKKDVIEKLCREYQLDLSNCKIIDVFFEKESAEKFADILYQKRQRSGLSRYGCLKLMRDRNYFGAMMVDTGEADAAISGVTKDYATTLQPALQVIGVYPDYNKIAGMYIIMTKQGIFFFADTTVQKNPTAEELVDIIGMTSEAVAFFQHEPRIAVLSYSNFGSIRGVVPEKVMKAVKLAKEKYPELVIDGDIQANVALNKKLQAEVYPFSELAKSGANTLIFPDLQSGNIAYKLLMELGVAEGIGPVLLGMNKSFHILQLGSSVREIVNMTAIAGLHAGIIEKREKGKRND